MSTKELGVAPSGATDTATKGYVDAIRPGLAVITSNVSIASTTETRLVGFTIPANSLQVGTTFRFTAFGNMTKAATSSNVTTRLRCGPTTLTGNVLTSVVPAVTSVASSAVPWGIIGQATVRSTGGSGTGIGSLQITCNAINSIALGNFVAASTNIATVVIDTTAANQIELTLQSSIATTSIVCYDASVERIFL